MDTREMGSIESATVEHQSGLCRRLLLKSDGGAMTSFIVIDVVDGSTETVIR